MKPTKLLLFALLFAAPLRGADKPSVQLLVGGQMAAAAGVDTTVKPTARLDTELPLDDVLERLQFNGSLDVSSLPDAAFAFQDLRTWSQGLRGDLAVSWSLTDGDVQVGPIGGWGFSTTSLGTADDQVQRHFARRYFAGVLLSVPGKGHLKFGYGRDEVAAPLTFGTGQWIIGARVPVPGTDQGAAVLIDAGLNVGPDNGDPLRRDYVLVNVAFDPVKAAKNLGK